MKLSDIATIKTNFQEADFWLIRRGSGSKVGKPTNTYNVEHIGIRVERTDLLLPKYLYYALRVKWSQGDWQSRTYGSLNLVHIRVSDVSNIRVIPTS